MSKLKSLVLLVFLSPFAPAILIVIVLFAFFLAIVREHYRRESYKPLAERLRN